MYGAIQVLRVSPQPVRRKVSLCLRGRGFASPVVLFRQRCLLRRLFIGSWPSEQQQQQQQQVLLLAVGRLGAISFFATRSDSPARCYTLRCAEPATLKIKPGICSVPRLYLGMSRTFVEPEFGLVWRNCSAKWDEVRLMGQRCPIHAQKC